MPWLHPLETDIEAFRSVIDYRRYRLSNPAAHIDPDADMSVRKMKRKVELLSPTLETFSEKDPMELLGFLATTTDAFNG